MTEIGKEEIARDKSSTQDNEAAETKVNSGRFCRLVK
jgi:hypothetical protein